MGDALKFKNTIRDKALNRKLAHMDGVQRSLDGPARIVESSARAALAAHRKTGEHRIEATRGYVDRWVSLVGPGALSLELGHHNTWSGEWVDGAHILGNALRGGHS